MTRERDVSGENAGQSDNAAQSDETGQSDSTDQSAKVGETDEADRAKGRADAIEQCHLQPGRQYPIVDETAAIDCVTVSNRDGPDECALFPRDGPESALESRWITAQEGSFVALADHR